MLIEVDAIAAEVNSPGHAVGAGQQGVGVQNNDPLRSFRPGLQQLYGLVYGRVVLRGTAAFSVERRRKIGG